VAEGATREPGVILSFDDAFVADWLAAMPLFERYKAHVTFFISHFERLTPEQIDGLHRIERAGHAIECHGLRHERAATYCREHSLEQWLECEVQPAVAWMRQEGFEPTAFAYPCSENDDQTDRALLGFSGTFGPTVVRRRANRWRRSIRSLRRRIGSPIAAASSPKGSIGPVRRSYRRLRRPWSGRPRGGSAWRSIRTTSATCRSGITLLRGRSRRFCTNRGSWDWRSTRFVICRRCRRHGLQGRRRPSRCTTGCASIVPQARRAMRRTQNKEKLLLPPLWASMIMLVLWRSSPFTSK